MVAHTLAAAKRLRKELQNLERNKDEEDDIWLFPDSDNILKWASLIRGPKDTPYEGGVFQLSILCGADYPLAPPKMSFMTKVRLCLISCCCSSSCFYFGTSVRSCAPPPPTDLLHFPKQFVKRCFILMSTFEQEIFASIFSKRNGRQHGVYRLPVGPF